MSTALDSSKLVVKFYAENDPSLDAGQTAHEVVEIFHAWIQTHAIRNHVLIDVADYAHVPNGPGTLLVSLEANFYLDRLDERLGITYARKLPQEGTFPERLALVIQSALDAASKLQKATGGKIKFKTDELMFQINDRLLAPNNPETFAQVRPELERFLKDIYGAASVQLTHRNDPRRLFEVNARISGAPATDAAGLLRQLRARQDAPAAPAATAPAP